MSAKALWMYLNNYTVAQLQYIRMVHDIHQVWEHRTANCLIVVTVRQNEHIPKIWLELTKKQQQEEWADINLAPANIHKNNQKNSHLEPADIVGEFSALLFVFLVDSDLLLALPLPLHFFSRLLSWRVGGGGRGQILEYLAQAVQLGCTRRERRESENKQRGVVTRPITSTPIKGIKPQSMTLRCPKWRLICEGTILAMVYFTRHRTSLPQRSLKYEILTI